MFEEDRGSADWRENSLEVVSDNSFIAQGINISAWRGTALKGAQDFDAE